MSVLTHARLREVLRYDRETGNFYRIDGAVAGSLNKKLGYWQIRLDDVLYYSHRLAWFWMTGAWPIDRIDHKDTDGANNRWDNLRDSTNSQNLANSRIPITNTSGVKGVTWYKPTGRWCAKIKVRQKSINLGYFDNIELAAAAYSRAAKQHFGEYARAA